MKRILRDLLAGWWYYAICLSFVMAVMAAVWNIWPQVFGGI